MGSSEPYLYDPPSKYTFGGSSEKGFNPRAATQASWVAPMSRPKSEGPLIHSKEFNRHPDSYITAPYGNLNWKPMSPRTKVKVKWLRLLQLTLRICALLGAVGMLFCVICIKGTGGSTGWIIRVPAAVAILHTLYAIYHLSRSSKGRTPASSASYMLFASVIDVGLIPFYVFTALLARTQLIEPTTTHGHWQTLFGDGDITEKILRAIWLIGVTDGSIHLASLLLSIYLAVLFRKISKLPPDMNPLEDNLTARPKHKRNKSSMVDSRISQATTVTANSHRESKDVDSETSPFRSVPFMHTRNDSHGDINNVPHPNFSPRVSRTDVSAPFYDQPPSHCSSRINFNDEKSSPVSLHRNSRTVFPNLMLEKDSGNHSPSPPRQSPPRKAEASQQQPIQRSPTKSSSVYSSNSNTNAFEDIQARIKRFNSTTSTVPDDNWITYPSPTPSPSPPREIRPLRIANKKTTAAASYQPLPQTSPFEYGPSANDENVPPSHQGLLPPLAPLEMNPPTPPPPGGKVSSWTNKARGIGGGTNLESRALTPANGNSFAGSSGPGTLGIGKARGAWGGTGAGVGTRVISRSGVEVGRSGILPNGGIRSREVSGKVMEEGRGKSGWL